jgi:protein-S-isoprenylcysteine O-methyltransferase Ste14
MLPWFVFVVASLPLVFMSWPSLRHRHPSGIMRFFGYETMLLLTVHNIEYWARDANPVFKLVSLALALTAAGVLAHGIYLLSRLGDGQDFIDDTRKLVVVGAYRYIRHPIYGAVLLFGWTMFVQDISVLSVALVGAMSAFLFAAARLEEQDTLERFGDDYAAYMKRSKMFIPFLF